MHFRGRMPCLGTHPDRYHQGTLLSRVGGRECMHRLLHSHMRPSTKSSGMSLEGALLLSPSEAPATAGQLDLSLAVGLHCRHLPKFPCRGRRHAHSSLEAQSQILIPMMTKLERDLAHLMYTNKTWPVPTSQFGDSWRFRTRRQDPPARRVVCGNWNLCTPFRPRRWGISSLVLDPRQAAADGCMYNCGRRITIVREKCDPVT